MKVSFQLTDITQVNADVLIVNAFEGVTTPAGATGAIDAALGGIISEELTRAVTFKGKLGDALVLPTYGKLPARHVIVVGLGKEADCKNLQLRRAAAVAIRAAQKLKANSVASIVHGAGVGNVPPAIAARLVVEGSLLGDYQFTKRKTPSPKPDATPIGSSITDFIVVEKHAEHQSEIESGIVIGQAIANATIQARDLVFDSANHVTPTVMAQVASSTANGSVSCKVLDKADIEALGMGSFLSVARGSVEPPKLIHLTYTPNGTPRKKVALVGKGITFDSGGLSLKPANAMELMKDDMSGAAVVISVMKAIAELGNLDVEVHAIAPCCENMPSGNANRPGDIVTAMNGKTIEINNTDAEGRLILNDALVYAQKHVQPDELIDLATLTGACVVALGKEASGIMGTDDGLIEGIRQAGDLAGERFWPLPLYDEYKEMLKSDVADLINAGSKGQAGSSAAGVFLKEFIEDGQKWVHLDIAGPAYTDRDVPETPKGATGVGVRTLLYYLYGFASV